MLARSHEGRFEMKFSFPFSMTVLNRFLSRVYLKEDSHHNVIEEIFSRKIDKCHHRERVLKKTLTVCWWWSPVRQSSHMIVSALA
jgi:hypothetical protein